MLRRKIRVFIVEDSTVYQTYLRHVIESDGMMEVIGCSDTGKEAFRLIGELKPDTVTLDLALPDVDRFELLQDLVRAYKIPIIVVSGQSRVCEDALRLGACDYIEKLQEDDSRTKEQFELLLKLKLKTQSNVKPAVHAVDKKPKKQYCRPEGTQERLIVIGASLGGTEVIMRLIQQLPAGLPGIVIVQHMPQGFTRAYAMRLDQNSEIAVHEAENNDLVLPGTALVAPGGKQLTIHSFGKGYRVKLGDEEKVGGFCPSVDVLFHSAAAAAGKNAVGVILTGMGRDGADGMKALHDSGAYTIGQEKESCAVFGMPAAAHALGGVDKLLTPDQIVQELIKTI